MGRAPCRAGGSRVVPCNTAGVFALRSRVQGYFFEGIQTAPPGSLSGWGCGFMYPRHTSRLGAHWGQQKSRSAYLAQTNTAAGKVLQRSMVPRWASGVARHLRVCPKKAPGWRLAALGRHRLGKQLQKCIIKAAGFLAAAHVKNADAGGGF